MDTRKQPQRNRRIVSALVVAMMATAMSANADAYVADTLKAKYEYQKRDLRLAHLNSMKLVRAGYQDQLAQIAAARRGALKLCEPDRGYALKQLKVAKRDAGVRYRDGLLLERKSYKSAAAELEVWYASARSQIHHSRVAVTTVPVVPSYVVEKTTTYRVPTTYSVQTVQPVRTPQYELIQPQGPVFEGPVFEGPIHSAPVYESPVEGPVFPAPRTQAPPAGVEFLPTASRGRPGNGARSTSVGDLVSIALRTLANQ